MALARIIRLEMLACVALAAVVLGGCGKEADGAPAAGGKSGARAAGGGAPGAARGARGGGRAGANDRPIPVEIVLVELGTVSRSSTISGVLEPLRIVAVNAQMTGVLLAVHAEEGSRVRKGQLLVEIDSRELQAQERAADASFKLAESTWRRTEQLFAGKIITVVEYDRDRAALESARAALDGLRTRLGYAQVLSPIDGVVTEKRVEAGDVVANQARLFTVADVAQLVTRVKVSELEVRSLRVGDTVPVSVDALGGERVTGRIRRVFPSADTATRLVPVEVALGGAALQRLRPGYTVRVTFALDQRGDAMLVPSRSVSGPVGSRAVYVVHEGKITRRAVAVGPDLDGKMEVMTGLTTGDSVIVSGSSLLREGGMARVVGPLGDESPARGGGGERGDSASRTPGKRRAG